MFLSFRTDRSGQSVQTQISLIRVYTVCNFLCIFWMHYSKEKSFCSTFRVITANFWVSEILGCLRYCKILGDVWFFRQISRSEISKLRWAIVMILSCPEGVVWSLFTLFAQTWLFLGALQYFKFSSANCWCQPNWILLYLSLHAVSRFNEYSPEIWSLNFPYGVSLPQYFRRNWKYFTLVAQFSLLLLFWSWLIFFL